MVQLANPPSPDTVGAGVTGKDSLLTQSSRLAAAFWASRQRNRLLALAAALVVVLAATAYTQIRLNAWNKPFYNALTHKDMPSFIAQLGVFAQLAGVLLVLNVAQVWLNQTSKVVLRQGLVNDLINMWLGPQRAFRLSNSGVIGVNPDQRLHADAQHLTDLMTDLGIGLLQSTLLLLSFIGVLWVLSRGMLVPLAGSHLQVPGYMVWCALLYAGTASFLSWRVGRPLIALDAERYAREADLRFALVHASEEIEGITIYRGEADEQDYLERVFATVQQVSRRIVGAVTRLTWVTAGYGWFTIVAPILVAAPSYLSGNMSFGELMVVVGAFNQVQSSLRWFVDNFPSIADWRATLLRVANFRNALASMDSLGDSASRITIEETDDDSLRIDELRVDAPFGCIRTSEAHLQVKAGERLLICGGQGAARNLLFRAIVGVWPWGSGRIRLPARRLIAFLPARAYVPSGTLRSALAYPRSAGEYDTAAVSHAFTVVGLERLLPELDEVERWDRRLSDDEKQCLAFARLILQRPHFVVVDGALDVLDSESRSRIESLLTTELRGVGLVNIGQEHYAGSLYQRRLRLVIDPHGPVFRPTDLHPAALATPAHA